MGSIQFSNVNQLVHSLDKNNNQIMDELQVDARVQGKVDTNKDGQVSQSELVSAMKADAVEIKSGVIRESQGFDIYVRGLDTLKNVNSTAKNGISNAHVWTPTMYSDDLSRDRYFKLLESNQAYDRAIDKMENSLTSIRDMTSHADDATSRAINIQAKTTLNSTKWRTWTARLQQNISLTRDYFDDYSPRSRNGGMRQTRDPFAGGGSNNDIGRDPFAGGGSNNDIGRDPFAGGGSNNDIGRDPFAGGGSNNRDPYGKDPFNGGGSNNNDPIIPNDPYMDRLDPHIREQEMINTNLQASYSTMNSALKAIKEQTDDLPDIHNNIKAADRTISQAFSNISSLEGQVHRASEVSSNLRTKADAREAEAGGRAGTFGGIGAGVGAAAGAAIGYFAGGRNVKSALIGAGVGAAVGGGGGALIGGSVDDGIRKEATDMRSLAQQVESYKVDADKAALNNQNQKLYNTLFDARQANNIDAAHVVDNNLDGIRSAANGIQSRTAQILSAYKNN